MSSNAEEFFFETLRVAAQAASAHEKTMLITVYPSQPYRSAVVAAYVTCPDDMAKEIAVAFNESESTNSSTQASSMKIATSMS
jgi:hypothetical protein